jgi:hypothetical protein
VKKVSIVNALQNITSGFRGLTTIIGSVWVRLSLGKILKLGGMLNSPAKTIF